MKKITVERAKNLIKNGIYPMCVINSKGDSVFVNSITELHNLEQLGDAGVQKFELFEVYSSLKIPNGSEELTFDEAFKLLCLGKPPIYAIMYDGKTLAFSNKNELVSFYRKQAIRKEPFKFYRCK